MSGHHVDQQYPLQQTHFTVPQQHQPHPQQPSASPRPQYYHAPQDHTNGYTNVQPYVDNAQTPTYATPSTEVQQKQQHPAQPTSARTSIVPPQSVTRETYQSPIIAQPGTDWANDLMKMAKNAELKKHTLTLQLHTAHILSAHSSLEQRNAKLESVRAEKNWLESERVRLLDCLRQVNEDKEKVDLSESTILKEISEFKNQIKNITDGEYGAAKKEVDTIRSELGMPPLPSLEATLEEKSARGFVPHTSIFGTDTGSPTGSSPNKRRLAQSTNDSAEHDASANTDSLDARPSLYSVAQANGNGATPIKRGPGRPRKVPVGGNNVPGPVVTNTPDGQSPAKRPRGRPKGSKNKPKVPPPDESAAET
ncbi:hypothetical protein RhiJN_00764 [Ceratobasidium sp. AG-Ba]|nr:hypothetical protein RhiJN_00764 [Ceratobasidium sp. AG-Ba]